MTDLVAWLTKILDEDEARFDDACETEAERYRKDGMPDETAEMVKAFWLDLPNDDTGWRWRLADIAAKRAIIELHNGPHNCTELRTGTYPDDWPKTASWGKAGERWQHPSNEYFEDLYCPTLRLEASAYAARPGYLDEWKP